MLLLSHSNRLILIRFYFFPAITCSIKNKQNQVLSIRAELGIALTHAFNNTDDLGLELFQQFESTAQQYNVLVIRHFEAGQIPISS